MTLAENLKAFKGLLAGIGVEHCSLSGGLECFDVNQAKIITDYLTDGYVSVKFSFIIFTAINFLHHYFNKCVE